MLFGTTGDCGSMPSCRATCRDGYDEMSAPSSRTVPACGCSTRASAFSRVDLPQAFGPTITVKEPSVTVTLRSSVTIRSS